MTDQGNKEMQKGEERCAKWPLPNSCLAGPSAAASLPDIGTLPERGAGPGTPLRQEPPPAYRSSLGLPHPWLHPGEKAGGGTASPERGWPNCCPCPQPSSPGYWNRSMKSTQGIYLVADGSHPSSELRPSCQKRSGER